MVIKKNKIKYLLGATVLALGIFWYNNFTTHPKIIEKSQTFKNITIANYVDIETGIKYLSDTNGKKTKVVACEKYFSGDVNPMVVLNQNMEYYNRGGKDIIIERDAIQSDWIKKERNFDFTESYYFQGSPSLNEIRSRLNEGDYKLESNLFFFYF